MQITKCLKNWNKIKECISYVTGIQTDKKKLNFKFK